MRYKKTLSEQDPQMKRSNYMRAVGAFCVGAVTLPLTARVDLAIWEMGLVAILAYFYLQRRRHDGERIFRSFVAPALFRPPRRHGQ
jgi:hypothetical protein